MKATGRISMTMTGMRKLSNWTARTKYTNSRAAARAMSRLPKLSIMVS